MSLKYYMISPLIVPKLKSGLNCKELKKFNFFYNQKTGEQIIEAETEKGINKNNAIISIKALLSDNTGQMLMNKLNTHFPDWQSVFCEINTTKKEINLIFLNAENKKIGNLKY